MTDPYQLNYNAIGAGTDEYCNICNPFQYEIDRFVDVARDAARTVFGV